MVRKHRFSFLVATVCSAAAVLLAGCGAAGSFPIVDPGTSAIGEIHGVNMGGHAPLAGSHIYLLEAGNSGYGSVAKSLISSSASGAVANGSWKNSGYSTDLFVPSVDAGGNTIYGLTADNGGGFTLTGDYTCDVGRAVYLVGVGGNPGTDGTVLSPGGSGVGVNISGSGSTETATIFVNASATPNVGDIWSFAGFSGPLAGLSGQSGYVVSVPQAGSLFEVVVPDPNGTVLGSSTNGNTYTTGLGTVQSTPFNHAAVNVAVLGTCPASGSFVSSIPFIYLNEVSTVAAAYAFQPYVATSGTNQTGIDEFHIGSSGTTLGMQGIQNAAANAANLYDIKGAANPSHGALSVLPTNSNGTVPQAELNTIANVLAGCVDSGNNYRNGVGTLQASCQTLFQYASSNGVYDTSSGNSWTLSTSTDAFNTFQAAVNMARFPQGAGVGSTTSGTQTVTTAFSTTTASSYTNALYALETGTVPFTPNLHSTSAGAPNGFTVMIQIVGNGVNNPGDIAIDASGNAWVAWTGSGTNEGGISEFSNVGTPLFNVLASSNNLGSPGGIAIDASGNVWVENTISNYVSKFSGTGTALTSYSGNGLTNYANGIAIDASGDVWVASGNLSEFSNSGAAVRNVSGNGLTNPSSSGYPGGMAIDGSGSVWVLDSGNNAVSKFSNTGTAVFEYTSSIGNGPTALAVDGSGNAWVANSGSNAIMKISNSGSLLFNISSPSVSNQYGLTIDGLGNAWLIARSSNYNIVEYSSSGTALLELTISGNLSANSGTGRTHLVTVDGSGDLWVLNSNGAGQVYEFIGIAPPVITPVSAGLPSTPTANGSSSLGTRP